jgi:hypothetical protein
MLLFQLPGVAEQWLCAENLSNPREWSAQTDRWQRNGTWARSLTAPCRRWRVAGRIV